MKKVIKENLILIIVLAAIASGIVYLEKTKNPSADYQCLYLAK